MILRDQFVITCEKSLQTFLKEKGKMSLKEMSQAAANIIDAHGYQTNTHGDTTHKKGPVVHKRPNDRKESNVKQANFGLCGHCGYRNHKTEDCRWKPQVNVTNKASGMPIVCFKCNKTGQQNECPSLKSLSLIHI